MKIRCFYKIRILRKFGIQAITLSPFILFADSRTDIPEALLRHELEHIYQVHRMGWWKFYSTYLRNYFSLRRQGLSHQKAYWNNPFEVAARQSESQTLTHLERELGGWQQS